MDDARFTMALMERFSERKVRGFLSPQQFLPLTATGQGSGKMPNKMIARAHRFCGKSDS